MEVDKTYDLAAIHYRKLCDVVFLHDMKGFNSIFIFLNAFRVYRHDVSSFEIPNINVFLKHSSKVAVSYNSCHFAVAVNNRRTTKAFARDFENCFGNECVRCYTWKLILQVDVRNFQIKLFSERAARMVFSEVLRGKVTLFKQTYGECITECKVRGSACCWCKIVWTCFFCNRCIEHEIGLLCEI